MNRVNGVSDFVITETRRRFLKRQDRKRFWKSVAGKFVITVAVVAAVVLFGILIHFVENM